MPWKSTSLSTLTGRTKAVYAEDVTPSDADNIDSTAGIYVGAQGNLRVTLVSMEDGEHVTFIDLAAGIVHPLIVKRVWTTGTTATGIVAVY